RLDPVLGGAGLGGKAQGLPRLPDQLLRAAARGGTLRAPDQRAPAQRDGVAGLQPRGAHRRGDAAVAGLRLPAGVPAQYGRAAAGQVPAAQQRDRRAPGTGRVARGDLQAVPGRGRHHRTGGRHPRPGAGAAGTMGRAPAAGQLRGARAPGHGHAPDHVPARHHRQPVRRDPSRLARDAGHSRAAAQVAVAPAAFPETAMEIRPILSTLMRHKTAATLIVLEIALTCAIICNALFMIGERITFVNEASGLAEDELVRVQITGIGNDDNAAAQTRTDLAALRGMPGVTAATVLNQVPFTNSSWNSGVRLSVDQTQANMVATVYMAEDQFMDTLGLRLVSGRWFHPGEYLEFETVDRAEGPVQIPGTVITRRMAERLFPGEEAVGKSFYSWGDQPIRIVGVVEHLVRPSLQGGPEAREYSMIFPIRPTYAVGGNYVIRTSPERRDEILDAAIKTLRASGPQRIVLEENTKTM